MAPPKGFIPHNKGKPGRPWTDEQRKKASLSHMGNPSRIGQKRSPEEIAKQVAATKGVPKSEAFRENLRNKLRGREFTPEWIEKIRESKDKKSDVEKRIISLKATITRIGACQMENNPNYKPDIERKYCKRFNSPFKIRTRLFFGKCVMCGISNDTERLAVHHVNNDKQTMCNGKQKLFVTLCRSCHGKTRNRKYMECWENHFTNLINTEYGGKCYLTEDEYRQRLIIELEKLEQQKRLDENS